MTATVTNELVFLKLDQVRMQVFNEKCNIPERKIVHC